MLVYFRLGILNFFHKQLFSPHPSLQSSSGAVKQVFRYTESDELVYILFVVWGSGDCFIIPLLESTKTDLEKMISSNIFRH